MSRVFPQNIANKISICYYYYKRPSGGNNMPENKTKAIGLRIKTIRLKHHITQKQLASHIGVSQTAIALWESGQRTVPLETIDHIAE